MLRQIRLTHFKCFELLKLPISDLTLLSGSNASGKSSVLQSLVLLHQTMRYHEWSTKLMLNGPDIRLGTMADVVDNVNGRRTFEIGLVSVENSCHWTFAGDREEMSARVESVEVNGKAYNGLAMLRHLLPTKASQQAKQLSESIRDLTYITAERMGPREVYPIEDRQIAPVVGPYGEHAVSVLHWGRDEVVPAELALPDAPPTRLRQVEQHMRVLFPGCGIKVSQVPHANIVTLGLRTSEDTDFLRPIHSGFGLTQCFPIIVAALSASRGDILLIENPEVHLHPAGQALIGKFLADVARVGVQVVIESHSDHVLNGIRRVVKSGQLLPDQVSLHFFRARGTDHAQVVNPSIDESGNIDTWPEGFFDQFDRDMNHFAGWD